MAKIESDNLKKLQKIVNEIEESQDFKIDGEYQKLTEDIDSLIHTEIVSINKEKNNNIKLRKYEGLFTSIINILDVNKQLVEKTIKINNIGTNLNGSRGY